MCLLQAHAQGQGLTQLGNPLSNLKTSLLSPLVIFLSEHFSVPKVHHVQINKEWWCWLFERILVSIRQAMA